MTIIRHTGVEVTYSKAKKLPLLHYKGTWLRFFPSVKGNWEEDYKTLNRWNNLGKEKMTVLVPEEFT